MTTRACKGTTRRGEQCRNLTSSLHGYCHRHSGRLSPSRLQFRWLPPPNPDMVAKLVIEFDTDEFARTLEEVKQRLLRNPTKVARLDTDHGSAFAVDSGVLRTERSRER